MHVRLTVGKIDVFHIGVVGHLASPEVDSAGTTYRHCECVSVGQLKSRK